MPRATERGFIGLIIILILALILAKYIFNWSIFEAASSPQGQHTVSYTRELLDTIWKYIGPPLVFIWERVLWPLLSLVWQSFQNFVAWGHKVAAEH